MPRAYNSESAEHERVVGYLRANYPTVIFRTDFAAGIKLPPWLAARQRRVQSRRGFPDIIIYEPTIHASTRKNSAPWPNHYCGLAIELKRPGAKLRKLNGEWASEHIKEQNDVLDQLKSKGYATSFAIGFQDAAAIIRWYMDGTESIQWEGNIPRITLGEVTDIEEAF